MAGPMTDLNAEALEAAGRGVMVHELTIEASPHKGGEYCNGTCSCGWMAGGSRAAVEKAHADHVANDPAKDFAAWLSRGPALAEATGLYIEIKVTQRGHDKQRGGAQ